ncbi:MAG: radical SAM protein, partial [Alphaproteobacteria bacterium]|nr:radical SAM protein [Alphaproteobacteria bacterium]
MVLFHLKTFGCQMNVYDSSRIVELLLENNMQPTEDETGADIVILNTCYIREKASAKIFSELGRLKKLYKDKPPVFAVIGCVAKAEGENIFKRAPFVSVVLSSQKYHLLPELLSKALAEKNAIEKGILEGAKKKKTKLSHLINTELSGLEKFGCLPSQKNSDKVAFVQVQEGCDKFCTYCVVPNTRGREVSRDEQSILDEVENLQNLGAVEINLLGQNVDCYNGLDKDGNWL